MKNIRLINKINNYICDNNFSIIYKDNSINIINYDKIIDFSSTKIKVSIDNIIYLIEGTNLVITKMYDDEILIKGNIDSIKK